MFESFSSEKISALNPDAVRRYSIGIELNIEIGELNAIKATYSDPGKCLTETILRSINYYPLSWKDIVIALEDALKPLGDTGNYNVPIIIIRPGKFDML